jgi:hypothetical protein
VVICRVPWPEFSQAPEDFLLAHLSRFTVRAPHGSTERGAFLGSGASVASGHAATSSALGVCPQVTLASRAAYCLEPPLPSGGQPSFLRPPGFDAMRWYRNINLLSIAYASRPRLRSRLTPGGLTSPGKPWACGERVSHPFYRYSYRHQLS